MGTGSWKVLGTDDNRPFRVFHDLRGVPAGTAVADEAVVEDTAGRVASARSDATVGEEPPVPDPGSAARDWLVVHYQRPDKAYDSWELTAGGDVAGGGPVTVPFAGEDVYGRFAWVRLAPGATSVRYAVAKGGQADGAEERTVDPRRMAEVWLTAGGCGAATSRVAAEGVATVHYHRPDADYAGWGLHLWGDALADGAATTWDAPRPPDGTDGFGAFWRVPVKNGAVPLNFIVHQGDTKGDAKDPGGDQAFTPAVQAEAFVASGDAAVHATRAAAEHAAVLHYHRADGDYSGWGLHVWTGAAAPTEWAKPLEPEATDAFGVTFRVPLADGATSLRYVVHKGDAKDLPDDRSLDLARFDDEAWLVGGTPGYLLPTVGGGRPDADLTRAAAQWVDRSTVAWKLRPADGFTYQLLASADGSVTVDERGKVSGDHAVIRLRPVSGGLTAAQRARFPHLAGHAALAVDPRDAGRVTAALRGQLVAVERDGGGLVRTATGVQLAGVLDDVYGAVAARAAVGPVWHDGRPNLSVWAPTATDVKLALYPDAKAASESRLVAMRRDTASGLWTVGGQHAWHGRYYTFQVTVYAPAAGEVVTNEVIDPYAVSLSADGKRSWLGDPAAPETVPAGWAGLRKPAAVPQAAASVYELHVRDFSASDAGVPAAERGTYAAFARPGSAGMRQLGDLAKAGLTHVQLLPMQDFATVPERRADRTEPAGGLGDLPPDSDEQQRRAAATAATDSFNWGYDPTGAFNAPEGSYASDPDGPARVRELRGAVGGLNRAGLRVVMDVVYNHTHAAGQDPTAVLDRIVPGYYHRLLDDGTVATSTCCANTAPEHRMMGKLVIDSVVTWARRYKVDGFRFDLMGHHPKANIVAVRHALDALTPARDGVDGKSILLYGEGWDFGEVAKNARFVQATQAELAGTGIGTFNDRLRDAVRGGGPFDADPRVQGLASGLGTADNGAPANGTAAERDARLLRYHDLVKIGMAGNLRDLEFTGSDGRPAAGKGVDYDGKPAGYAATPGEAITYVDAHDNETLFDALAFKLPQATTMADRSRLQRVALSTVLLGQGTAFVHAGSERLRSKSLDRNSFDSGDWFNRLLWDCADGNGFGAGLPPAADNQGRWPYAGPLLADPALRAGCADVEATRAGVLDLLRVRRSSPLFSLGDGPEVARRVTFPLTGDGRDRPGVLALHVSDAVAGARPLDPRWSAVTVLVNASGAAAPVMVPALRGVGAALHPVQAAGSDPVVRGTRVDDTTGTVTVPARTVAVVVTPRR